MANPNLGKCRCITDFNKNAVIGEGTYGTVYMARDKESGETVALKKIKIDKNIDKEGMPLTALREIQILKGCSHPNVVRLLGVAVGYQLTSIFLIFEYCEHDMADLLDHYHVKFKESETKCLMLQLLRGVEFLQQKFIMHRDLKLSNLLYTNRGVLKICDFGLARIFGHPPKSYSPKVLTLWYRAPEVLLGEVKYTGAIDMWSVGCIFGELLQGSPLLPGSTDIEQLQMIFRLLGSPDDRVFKQLAKLPLAPTLLLQANDFQTGSLGRKVLPTASDTAVAFLTEMLALVPDERITVQEAQCHRYFDEIPYAADPSMMPSFPTLHGTKSYSPTVGRAPPGAPVKRKGPEDDPSTLSSTLRALAAAKRTKH